MAEQGYFDVPQSNEITILSLKETPFLFTLENKGGDFFSFVHLSMQYMHPCLDCIHCWVHFPNNLNFRDNW